MATKILKETKKENKETTKEHAKLRKVMPEFNDGIFGISIDLA